MIDEILELAVNNGASDIHLNTNNPPVIRVDGVIRRLEVPVMTPGEVEICIKEMLTDKMYKDLLEGEDIDASYTNAKGDRFRINVYRQKGEFAAAIRALSSGVPTLEEFGLPKVLTDLSELQRGLVLVTGPTGSGKSTTLAAMINHININKAVHILTLEDPIEYIHEQKKSMMTQREIHKDSKSFDSSLRSALREDPDVILVGEMRDPETIQLALTAAETGHLVLSTLHTIGAPDTINRIIDSFPSGQQDQVRAQLSTSLKAVVSQALVPKKNGGRIAAHEIMIANTAISANIRQNKIQNIPSAIMSGVSVGMQSIDVNLAELVKDGAITREIAFEVAKDKDALERRLRRF